jgi:hypothetical protein
MAATTIVINFPNWPNETVICTEAEADLPSVVLIDGRNMSEEQKKALLQARNEFIDQVRASIAARR